MLLGEEKSIFPVFCPEISEPQESSVRGCVGCFVWRLSPAPVVRGKRPHGMAECEHSDRRTRMPRCCSCARSSILRELTYLLPRSSSSARRPPSTWRMQTKTGRTWPFPTIPSGCEETRRRGASMTGERGRHLPLHRPLSIRLLRRFLIGKASATPPLTKRLART